MAKWRNPRAGLFCGTWTDLAGKKIRKVQRQEYGELYRLWAKHRDIRLGITTIGQKHNG